MNAAEKLAAEIERVSALREQYRELDGTPGVNVKPAIFLMTASLERAKQVAGTDDAVEYLRAIKDLEGFTG